MSDRCAPASGSIFSYGNLYRCYLKCRRKKRNTFNALQFEINVEENLIKLEQELNTRVYHPSHSILFAATKPKLREIFAADFRDRVVHHILVDQLEKIWEPVFIHDSYACRNNKGTHRAVVRVKSFLRKITKNGHVQVFYLQLDIKDFFCSINKEILFNLIAHKVSDPGILWLTKKILFWDCTQSFTPKGDPALLKYVPPHKSLFGKENNRGLPIGNLTSQFFANVYLNSLDQFVKHELKAHYYLRYVDDFVLLSRDQNELLRWKDQISTFLDKKLHLHLHPKRQKLQPVSNGIDFLGYVIRPGYILVRNRVVNNLKTKLKNFKGSIEARRDMIASYMGHFKYANAYNLTQKFAGVI